MEDIYTRIDEEIYEAVKIAGKMRKRAAAMRRAEANQEIKRWASEVLDMEQSMSNAHSWSGIDKATAEIEYEV